MKAILRSVSRSFYLTIRFLPRPLREPVSLAYLLARATDTIADTAAIPAATRLTTLLAFARVIAGESDFDAVAEPLRAFAAQQSDPAEHKLIENLRGCIDWLATVNRADRDDIRNVLQTIVRGQELDVRRFGDPAVVTSLRSAAELDEYTFLVAGCVGDFWTKLGFRHLRSFASRSPNEMAKLGIEYGKGLQLINVLRDSGADAKCGRGYLPSDELAGQPVAEVFAHWLDQAEERLEAGIDYCSALTNWRMRFATALPALIGARTLTLLRQAGPEARARKIKVARKTVRRILVASLAAAASPTALRALFQRLLEAPR
ncbi:MAG TPA: squalene/phytoene synthase family protein [Chthoniobacterales bacterium]|nr:squalene/phytoene synthase family protein [Chthoniobacterales bacterium]